MHPTSEKTSAPQTEKTHPLFSYADGNVVSPLSPRSPPMHQGGRKATFRKVKLSKKYLLTFRNHGVFRQKGMLKLS